MHFEVLTNTASLESLDDEWNRLATPSPMQSHEWLSTWWECHASDHRRLAVVVARQGGQLVGVAPWYLQRRLGRTALRWLADGRVASDHHTLLAAEGQQSRFASALAQWLLRQRELPWGSLKLEAVDSRDPNCGGLLQALSQAGCPQLGRPDVGSCAIDLPGDWENYLMQVSKNHRKRCRRWYKQYFETGRATVDVATTTSECMASWQNLIDLHNARRATVGQQGAFHDPRFAEFLRRVTPKLADRGSVQLRLLRIDERPLAAEYVLLGPDCWYAYQSGLSPAGQEHAAGSLSILAMLRDAVAAGCTRFDLLRGDEDYKFSWGATHRPASTLTVRPPSLVARATTYGEAAVLLAKRARRHLVGKNF